jgi:hypothetical protein
MEMTRGASLQIFGNMLTEMRNPAQITVTPDEVLEYAKSAGARFIKLRYTGGTASRIKGFQPGVLNISRGRDGVALGWTGKTESDGRPAKTGNLSFLPDKLGVLWAYVPAFEANLRLLAACHSNDSAEWVIVDDKDRNEIDVLADKYADELGWSREKISRGKEIPYRELFKNKMQHKVEIAVAAAMANQNNLANVAAAKPAAPVAVATDSAEVASIRAKRKAVLPEPKGDVIEHNANSNFLKV